MNEIKNDYVLEKLKDSGLVDVFSKILENNCKISKEQSNKLFSLLLDKSIDRVFSEISVDNLNNINKIKNIKEKELESLIKK